MKFSTEEREAIVKRWVGLMDKMSGSKSSIAEMMISDAYLILLNEHNKPSDMVYYHEKRFNLSEKLRSKDGMIYNLEEIIKYKTASIFAKYC